MKAKNQRLILAVMALIALLGAGALAASALKEEASYFYTPTTLAKARIAPDAAIRLGGMVKRGSIKRAADGVTVNFIVQDQTGEVAVTYRGITPDLFVEGSGVVADGRMDGKPGKGGVFVADHMLAKHDENYVPRELKDIDMTAAVKTQESIAQ